MREIKYRGMCANGIMRYGRLHQDKEDETAYYKEYSQRICWDNSNIPVSNKSLGQFTGLTDKNGKDIYEGDIFTGDDGYNEVVTYEENKFIIKPQGDDCIYWEECVIIGNIHENPEYVANTY